MAEAYIRSQVVPSYRTCRRALPPLRWWTFSRKVRGMIRVGEVVVGDRALLRVLDTYANLQRVVLAL